MSKMILIIWK